MFRGHFYKMKTAFNVYLFLPLLTLLNILSLVPREEAINLAGTLSNMFRKVSINQTIRRFADCLKRASNRSSFAELHFSIKNTGEMSKFRKIVHHRLVIGNCNITDLTVLDSLDVHISVLLSKKALSRKTDFVWLTKPQNNVSFVFLCVPNQKAFFDKVDVLDILPDIQSKSLFSTDFSLQCSRRNLAIHASRKSLDEFSNI